MSGFGTSSTGAPPPSPILTTLLSCLAWPGATDSAATAINSSSAFQATARGRNSPPNRSSPRLSPDSNPSASKSAFLPRHAFCHHSSRTRRPRRHRVDHCSRFARTVGAVEFCCDFPATFSSPHCTSLHLFPISTRMSLQLHATAVVLRSFPILRVLRGTA